MRIVEETLQFEGSTLAPGSIPLDWRTATPDYFRTLGIPMVEGRYFQESDTMDHGRLGSSTSAGRVWCGESKCNRQAIQMSVPAPALNFLHSPAEHILYKTQDSGRLRCRLAELQSRENSGGRNWHYGCNDCD